MNKHKVCYNIFHIDGLGESSTERKEIYNKVISFLDGKIDRLYTESIHIKNQEDYQNFCENVLDLKSRVKYLYKPGEIGLWASSLVAINNFLESDYEVLVLMEDDIEIFNNFDLLLYEYINLLPEDWDIFSYYVHENQYFNFDKTYGDQEVVPTYQNWSTLCWLLTKSGAKKMIKDIKNNGIIGPIDWYIFHNKEKFNSYTISPTARKGCALNALYSTIQAEDRTISPKEQQ